MLHVLSRWRSGCGWSWTGFLGALAALILLLDSSRAMGQSAAKKSPAPATKAEAGKADNADEQEARTAPAPDVAAPVADPSQTRHVEQIEVFKDPLAEDLLNMGKVISSPVVTITDNEMAQIRDQAGNPNLTFNRQLMDKVVRGLVGQLTDKKNIHELLKDPEEGAPKEIVPKKAGAKASKPEGDGGKAIEKATADMLDLVFRARGSKNEAFLTAYRRMLKDYLSPLLKNHLVPRVQAMIVLGEAASPEYIEIFRTEIANRSQALWVKLWAIEGVTNIKKGGGRFQADQESKVAKTISEFLEKQKDLPWPIQYRGLEALGSLRQAGLPTQMRPGATWPTRPCSSSRTPTRGSRSGPRRPALWGSCISAACPGSTSAWWPTSPRSSRPTWPRNSTTSTPRSRRRWTTILKARFLSSLLVGPVYQSFEGIPGENNSGLLQMIPEATTASRKYVQKRLRPGQAGRPGIDGPVRSTSAPVQGSEAEAGQADRGPAEVSRRESAGQPPLDRQGPGVRQRQCSRHATPCRPSTPGGHPAWTIAVPAPMRTPWPSRYPRSATITPSTPRSSVISIEAAG